VADIVESGSFTVEFGAQTYSVHPIKNSRLVVHGERSTSSSPVTTSLQAVIPIIHSCEDDGREEISLEGNFTCIHRVDVVNTESNVKTGESR
jgi:hypothetical protein